MALKESRQVFQTNIDFASSGTMERGGIASIAPWVDGLVYYAAGSGLVPAGLVLEDVETLNFFTHPQYLNRNVSPRGSVVGIATEGEFWTDMIDANLTYKSGDTLYLIGSGKLTNQSSKDQLSDSYIIGTCLAGKDSENFIKVRIDIQNNLIT